MVDVTALPDGTGGRIVAQLDIADDMVDRRNASLGCGHWFVCVDRVPAGHDDVLRRGNIQDP